MSKHRKQANVGRSMRRRLRPFTAIFAMVGLVAGGEMSAAIATEFLADKEAELTALLNDAREVNGLPALPTSDALRTVSRRHTQKMMLAGTIFHSDDLRGETEEFFPDWAKIGENVGVGPTIPMTHQAFMDSPGHRANILDGAWQTLAIGVIADGNRLFMTQRFLKLRSGTAVPPDALASENDTRTPASGTGLPVLRLSGSSRVETAKAVIDHAFASGSATGAVLADAFDFHGALAGSALAGQLDGPTVLSSTTALDSAAADALVGALGRNSGRTVHVMGNFAPAVLQSVRDLGLTVSQVTGNGFADEAANAARALPEAPDTAIVARIDSYPDALAASAVAAHTGWPILFTETGALNGATRAVLIELDIATVHVVGGTGAVSAATASSIEGLGIDVQRHSGPSRIDTALAIADLGIAEGMSASIVQLATARAFPDALAGGAVAPELGAPVILTEPGALSPEVADWLRARGSSLQQVLLLGGRGALSDAVESAVRALR